MTVNARFRLGLIAVILAAAYFYLLIYLTGSLSSHERPRWWIGAFPTRYVGALAWLVALHTIGVLSAALPIAIAAVCIARKRAVSLGLYASTLATVAAMVPLLGSSVWPIIWASNPVLFVTDQTKLVLAVPLIAWVILRVSSNNRFERSRVASSLTRGVGG